MRLKNIRLVLKMIVAVCRKIRDLLVEPNNFKKKLR